MDAHDDARHSSLPKSLLPHLFHHPRTDLPPPNPPLPPPPPAPYHHRYPEPEPLFPPAPSRTRTPVYNFPPPPVPRHYSPPRANWSEGEAGPSSLLHHTRHRRSDSLSPRLAPRYDAFGRTNSNYEHESLFVDHVRRDVDREPYLLLPGPPIQQQSYHLPHQLSSYHGTDHLVPSSDDAHFSFRHDPYPPYPSISSLSLNTPPQQTHFTSPGSAEGAYSYRSDSYTDSFGTRDGETLPPELATSSSSKYPRTDSPQDAGTPRQQPTPPRKTAVACNFCRGRKLRCNGVRPTCSHCAARKIKCEYVSTPKRRGPGKKNPKGSRTKNAGASRLDPSSTAGSSNINNATAADRPPSAVLPTYELAAQAPEMRPYTHVMSLDTLDIFSFQSPAPAPRYPSPPDLRRQHLQQQYYYSHTRSPRRRETSSEDQSGAEM